MDATEFYLNTPLYTNVVIEKIDDLNRILTYTDWKDIVGYNPISKIDTTYTLVGGYSKYSQGTQSRPTLNDLDDVPFEVCLKCLRTGIKFSFNGHWYGPQKILVKYGQYPSLADFHISQIKQYDKILGKEDLREFTKAIGLAANGIGIGSFVYLRRIFEKLIFEAADVMIEEGFLDKKTLRGMRMDEKINHLKNYLPEFLVAHKELYSILSLGIHQLSEQECLEYFETVKVGIEFILDEKLEKALKAKKIADASIKIKSIISVVKGT